MKKPLLITIVILIVGIGLRLHGGELPQPDQDLAYRNAVDGAGPCTVVAESGLNLREASSINSPVLKKLPFGTILYSYAWMYAEDQLGTHYKSDTISGVAGYWVDAALPDEKIKGYVFSPYIYTRAIRFDPPSDKPFRISFEGYNCEDVDYYPGLVWYGLYQRQDTFLLQPVEVKMLLPRLQSPTEAQEYADDGNWSFFLETNRAETAVFLLGLATEGVLEEGKVHTSYVSEESGFSKKCNNGYLYPTETIEAYLEGRRYLIEAFEEITLGQENEIQRAYNLRYLIQKSYIEEKRINISESLGLHLPAETHAIYQTPQIKWLGDLNRDGGLDVIVYQHTMTDGCGVCWTSSLFLSHPDEAGKSYELELADSEQDCNCM